MTIAVRKTYACPTCGESFTKWGLCQSHVRSSAPCREALGEKLRDPDALQELCRVTAGASIAEPNTLLPQGSSQMPLSVAPPGIAAGATICPAPGLQAPPGFSGFSATHENGNGGASVLEPDGNTISVEVMGAHQLRAAVKVRKRLYRAQRNGSITEGDRNDFEKLQDLREQTPEVQIAAVEKFLGVGARQLRRIANKVAWFQSCLTFCKRTNLAEPLLNGSGSGSSRILVDALASQALLPDALSQECWELYAQLSEELQECIANAVRSSILVNVQRGLSEHFSNIVCNERAIYRLENSPAPRIEHPPLQVSMEDIDGGKYQKLFQQMFFRQKTAEELLLKELAEIDEEIAPGDPGSLLYTHLATREARSQGSAEVLSILHAAAANGLVRICARFIAEGLDVNERSGTQELAPLHLAASAGEVEVVQLLLRQRADPNTRGGDGHSALFAAILKAVQFGSPNEGNCCAASASDYSVQLKVCTELLLAGAENTPESSFATDEEPQSPEDLAKANDLKEIKNVICLHALLKQMKQKWNIPEVAVRELCKLQYETAQFLLIAFDEHAELDDEAASTELGALLSSEYVKKRDEVQRFGNRLIRKLHLSNRAMEELMQLPPVAGLHALNTWKIEELVANVYAVPEHLNAPSAALEGTLDAGVEGDGTAGTARGLESLNGVSGGAGRQAGNEEPKLTGRVRKWESLRGFGFVVQDPREGEDHTKDVFVHRKNITGSTPQNHLDLKEGCRISYRLGEQDGRPRALDVRVIDANGDPVPRPGDESYGLSGDGLDGFDSHDDCDEDRLTRMFVKHLRSKEVLDLAREKRLESDAWMRCVGWRRTQGRREDCLWKKEIEHRIDVFLEKRTTPMQKKDFDFRVKKYLHEFAVHTGCVSRVCQALAFVEEQIGGKSRHEVQNWPAYTATLLRRFDPHLYESLAERDRRARQDQKKVREAETLDSTLGGATTLGSTGEAFEGANPSTMDSSGPRAWLGAYQGGDNSDREDNAAGSGSDSDRHDSRHSSRSGSRSSSPRASSEGGDAVASSTESDRTPLPPPKLGPPPPPPTGPPPPPPGGPRSPGFAGGAAPGLFAAAMKAAGVAGSSSGGPLARKTFQ